MNVDDGGATGLRCSRMTLCCSPESARCTGARGDLRVTTESLAAADGGVGGGDDRIIGRQNRDDDAEECDEFDALTDDADDMFTTCSDVWNSPS